MLTVDVEDYFQVSAFDHRIKREEWDSMPCRVEANTEHLLSIFSDAGVKGTFFVLGWVAKKTPPVDPSDFRSGARTSITWLLASTRLHFESERIQARH